MSEPWATDRELDAAGVRDAVRAAHPDLEAADIRHLGSGWDNDVYLVDGLWVFRFPRRRAVAGRIETDAAAAELGAEVLEDLEVAVPCVERIAGPAADFPHRFSGYRLCPGRPAPDAPEPDEARRLGTGLGRIFTRLHSVDPGRAREAGVEPDQEGAPEWRAELLEIADDLAQREGDWILPLLEDTVAAPLPPPPPDVPVFIHNDICPAHVLVEGERIVGLLDFDDAALGDPALDFAMLPPWLGAVGLQAALEAYGLDAEEGLRERARYLARVTSLTWLHDAHLGRGELEKHREWARRAWA